MQITQNADAANTALPQYGSKPQRPGLYLGLFHGRHDPKERMDDWGFNGPAIGPLMWCHTTYASNVRVKFEFASDGEEYFGAPDTEFELSVNGDMLAFNGMYFGDWTVYYVKPDECELPPDTFREALRGNELVAHRKFFI
ncbi:MAG: hypothetical protein Q7T10_10080 [Rhodoferax sp.]|uniref:hypothetical protein n=1 Tax=Rhodoferax sp. TaxID=50421 RepID=UPI002717FC9C|nr:hypothetical protein [Rhodoferax sp.]MDO8449137.1 hypothetical protein [Rhodoferax sp.]